MSDKPKIHFDLPTGIEATDITQVFTSKPYPVIVIDAMTSWGGLSGINAFQGIVEAVETTGEVVGIELRPNLQDITMEDEAVETTGEVVGIELRPNLQDITMEDEAVATTADITAFALESKVVSTTMEDEAVAVTATITGLELS